ncbi:MAG: alpha/beta hydrolase [Kineosporiaceae bacterium]|nr:alpha/beta hydrolase [Aeromicrobium sp.]
MDRRRAITLLGAGFLVAACTPKGSKTVSKTDSEKIAYGKDPSQFGELFRPEGTPRGVVVVIHGGFWHAQYDLSLGRPLAEDLAAKGWIAWNLEYRRIENGGGWPTTFDDIDTGIDKLADIPNIATDKVVTLGHSAGGHLGVWAAARPALTGSNWADPKVPVTAAISQAGILDFTAAAAMHLGNDAVQEFMGGTVDGRAVDNRYVLADPTRQIPLKVPVWCVHGRSDNTVPISQSIDYVKAAKAAGARAELVEVDGDHFVLIDPSTKAWQRTLAILDSL